MNYNENNSELCYEKCRFSSLENKAGKIRRERGERQCYHKKERLGPTNRLTYEPDQTSGVLMHGWAHGTE